MNTITHSQRYLPHKLSTKYYAVKLYRTGVGVAFVCRRYHISKASLMRWNKKFDGTKESLLDKSHKPHTPHLIHIQPQNSNGSAIIIDVIPKYLFVSCTENLEPTKDIPDIPVPYIACIAGWDIPVLLHLQRK